MEVVNPRYSPTASRPALTAAQRTQLRAALWQNVSQLPVERETVGVQEIAAQVRASVPDVPPDRYDGRDVAEALRQLGLELRG